LEHLESLDQTVPVWAVQSPQNNAVTAQLRKAGRSNITSFQLEEFGTLIETVDQHHPEWRELEVYGLAVGDAVAALGRFGGGMFTPTQDGFMFQRNPQD
jgi:hypothetical protein